MIIRNLFGKLMLLVIVNLFLVGSVILFLKNNQFQVVVEDKGVSESIKTPLSKETTPIPNSAAQPLDLLAIASEHNSLSDCFIIYSGQLYDVTPYFGSHPGGDAVLLSYCGQDATEAFNTKGKNPSSPHSDFARKLLENYLITVK